MPDVVGVAQGHVAIMLALTGMHVEEVGNAREAQEAIEGLLESDTQFVIVQESFRDGFSPWFKERLTAHRGLPLVVYCPAFDKEDSEVDDPGRSFGRPWVTKSVW